MLERVSNGSNLSIFATVFEDVGLCTSLLVSLPFPGTLQQVEVQVIGHRQCDCFYGVRKISKNMICSGLLHGGKDSCQVL